MPDAFAQRTQSRGRTCLEEITQALHDCTEARNMLYIRIAVVSVFFGDVARGAAAAVTRTASQPPHLCCQNSRHSRSHFSQNAGQNRSIGQVFQACNRCKATRAAVDLQRVETVRRSQPKPQNSCFLPIPKRRCRSAQHSNRQHAKINTNTPLRHQQTHGVAQNRAAYLHGPKRSVGKTVNGYPKTL